jgi:hypothetical protein
MFILVDFSTIRNANMVDVHTSEMCTVLNFCVMINSPKSSQFLLRLYLCNMKDGSHVKYIFTSALAEIGSGACKTWCGGGS